ncbi:MAG: hypothetical protein LBR27_04140 [Bifidobacteriaceae bacterium]|jgi:hypothetical protein|nr:hypothetical protein [Bifidobacteriaceae bacterium]
MNLKQVSRCVLYARLSVTEEESVSIERQLQSGRSYASARLRLTRSARGLARWWEGALGNTYQLRPTRLGA